MSMSLRHRDQTLRLDVHDLSEDMAGAVSRPRAHDAESGRGLLLVQEAADAFGIDHQDGAGKSVYAEWRTGEPDTR